MELIVIQIRSFLNLSIHQQREKEIMSRLEILKSSLEKKESLFSTKISDHFATVRQANGQPVNDKRNGAATLRKWESQNDSLRNLDKSIEVTKAAIEKEEYKIKVCQAVKEVLPEVFIRLIEEKKINQWRKFPNRFFVEGVEKARIIYKSDTNTITCQYVSEIPKGTGQYEIFRDCFNYIRSQLNG